MYEAMDLLQWNIRQVEDAVFFHVANLFNLVVDVIFYDTTTVSLSIDEEDEDSDTGPGLRKVDAAKKVREDLRGWKLGRALFVADSAMNSATNRGVREIPFGHPHGQRFGEQGRCAHQAGLGLKLVYYSGGEAKAKHRGQSGLLRAIHIPAAKEQVEYLAGPSDLYTCIRLQSISGFVVLSMPKVRDYK